jgi:hypothetical protein
MARFTENRTYEVVSTEGLWVYRVQNATDLSSFPIILAMALMVK